MIIDSDDDGYQILYDEFITILGQNGYNINTIKYNCRLLDKLKFYFKSINSNDDDDLDNMYNRIYNNPDYGWGDINFINFSESTTISKFTNLLKIRNTYQYILDSVDEIIKIETIQLASAIIMILESFYGNISLKQNKLYLHFIDKYPDLEHFNSSFLNKSWGFGIEQEFSIYVGPINKSDFNDTIDFISDKINEFKSVYSELPVDKLNETEREILANIAKY